MIDFATLQGLTIPEGVVTEIKDVAGRVLWAMQAGGWPDNIDTGLEFASASAFTISASSPGWDGTMAYSNGEGWKTWDGSAISSGEAENGQRIYLRGTGNTKVAGGSANKWTLTGTGIECNGNIEKLLDYSAVSAGKHPDMADSCYQYMFRDCTGLTTAPSLTATTLADSCYYSMFRGCTGLTTAPSLPATTLASNCYQYMFYGCTSLTTAPSLPATTLASKCYYSMFSDCTSLTTAPSLPATTLANNCYYNMFYGCTGLTTAPSLPATTLADSCYQYMFRDCTSLTTAPSLPATTLASKCYYGMFRDCTKIKLSKTQTGEYQTAYRIPTSGTGTTASDALRNMFSSTGGTFKSSPSINTTYYLDSSNTIV